MPSSLYLHCANLGDSGYFLLRNSRVVSRSAFQRDGRIVKQLAVIPPRYVGHSYCDDPPEDSSLTHCEVQDGDILIVASDGLWDNLIPPPPLFFHYIFGLMSHDGSLINWNEQLKEKVESIVAECQWEADRDQKDYHLGSSEIFDENPFVGTNDNAIDKKSKRNSSLVRKLCDRLVQEATSFMNTMHGKPDDLTVLVAQICRC
jgi:serine/threonine protein phosphatase PrpC